jgi:hypothetical protein
LAVVGSETIWTGDRGMPLANVRDGLSQTGLLVEVARSGIDWMEPRDLPFSALKAGIAAANGMRPSSNHSGCFHIAFADASARPVVQTISPEVLEALFTRAGGEEIPDDW